MAKQLVNPLERHVEKAVVGVAALVLIGAAARFLLTSPNHIELGNETVTPRTIDTKVAERAAEILGRIRSVRAEVTTPEPLVDEFIAAAQALNAPPLAAAAPFGPDVPLVDPPSTIGGHASMVRVLKPAKPQVVSGRSTIKFPGPSGEDRYAAVNWVTLSALFDVKGQADLQRHAGLIADRYYDAPSRDLIVIGVTGTNGKTTCTQLLAQTLDHCAVIGTLGYGFPGALDTSLHTTPSKS